MHMSAASAGREVAVEAEARRQRRVKREVDGARREPAGRTALPSLNRVVPRGPGFANTGAALRRWSRRTKVSVERDDEAAAFAEGERTDASGRGPCARLLGILPRNAGARARCRPNTGARWPHARPDLRRERRTCARRCGESCASKTLLQIQPPSTTNVCFEHIRLSSAASHNAIRAMSGG